MCHITENMKSKSFHLIVPLIPFCEKNKKNNNMVIGSMNIKLIIRK